MPGNLEESQSKIETHKDDEDISEQTKIVKDDSGIGLDNIIQDEFVDDESDIGDEFEENKSYVHQ